MLSIKFKTSKCTCDTIAIKHRLALKISALNHPPTGLRSVISMTNSLPLEIAY